MKIWVTRLQEIMKDNKLDALKAYDKLSKEVEESSVPPQFAQSYKLAWLEFKRKINQNVR